MAMLSFRVSDEKKRQYEEVAEQVGCSVSEWLKGLADAACGALVAPAAKKRTSGATVKADPVAAAKQVVQKVASGRASSVEKLPGSDCLQPCHCLNCRVIRANLPAGGR